MRKSKMDQRSESEFSIGVPVRASRRSETISLLERAF